MYNSPVCLLRHSSTLMSPAASERGYLLPGVEVYQVWDGGRGKTLCAEGNVLVLEGSGVSTNRLEMQSSLEALIQVWASPEWRSVFLDPTCMLPLLECLNVWEGVRHVYLLLYPAVLWC